MSQHDDDADRLLEPMDSLTIARLSFVSGRSAGNPGVTLYRTHWTDGGPLTLCGRNIDAERMERLNSNDTPTCGRCRDKRKQDEIAGELLTAIARRKPMEERNDETAKTVTMTQQELDAVNTALQQEHLLTLEHQEQETP